MDSESGADRSRQAGGNAYPHATPGTVTRSELPPPEVPLSEAVRHALGLSEAGAEIVRRIRCGDPVRRPQPGGQNWAGAEYLDLMGFTVGVESRTLERPYYRLIPRQPDVLEIYDQAYMLQREVRDQRGKVLPGRGHVPDSFCIRSSRVHFVECKLWERLEALSEKYPDMYLLGEDGRWRSPAAERALEGTGIGYDVFTNRDINETLLRNVAFIRDFEREKGPGEEAIRKVASALELRALLTIEELVDVIGDRRTIYCAIAKCRVFFDLARDLLSDDRSLVFRDEISWQAEKILRTNPPKATIPAPQVELKRGTPVRLDGGNAEIVAVDKQSIWFRAESGCGTQFARSQIVPLLTTRRLEWLGDFREVGALAREKVASATLDELTRAIATYKSIEPWICGAKRGGTSRKNRRDIAHYRLAESLFGHGFVGLLDRIRLRGNRTDRLTVEQEKLVKHFIEVEYLDNARSIDGTLALLNVALEACGESRIGRKTLKRRIDRIPPEDRERRRHGHRMANAVRPPHAATGQPAKGERAFEVGHIDSLSVPIELRSRRTGLVLRPPLWATVLWNAYPPYPLGLSLQFEKPSTRSVMAACRDCVRRYNRLPDTIYHDLGPEHETLTFDLMKAQYGVDFLSRPGGNARFGADIETHIGNFKTWVREMLGSYKRLPRRALAASHHPANVTLWYWDSFFDVFHALVFDDWPEMGHEGAACKPRVLWSKSIADQGDRPSRYIAYDEAFLVVTMPIVKNAARVDPTRGIRYKYVWYHAAELDDPRWHKKDLTLREPVDESHIIVQLGADWVRCDPVSYVFRLFSHREQHILLEEWRDEARQTNSEERRTPEAFERYMQRIAETEQRFLQAEAARAASRDQAPSSTDNPPTKEEECKENADEFNFQPDPIL